MLPEVTDFCRLILFRHPELDAAHAGIALGQQPAKLSRRGRERVLGWIRSLQRQPLDRVFAADVAHCLEPAQALAQARELEVVADPRLRDQDMGEWTGQPWTGLVSADSVRVRAFFEQFGDVAPPGGESLGESIDRFLQWWTELAPSDGKTYAVVTSGAMIGGFTAAMLGMRLSRSISLNLPHGAMAILEMFSNGARLATWHPEAVVDEFA